jgi:hypothetical protein
MMVLVLPLMFSSCSKDDEISLPGTEWVAMQGELEIHLKFVDKTKFKSVTYVDGIQIDVEEGTYRLSGSTITLEYPDEEDSPILQGTIKGNTMSFTYEIDSIKFEYVFTKK